MLALCSLQHALLFGPRKRCGHDEAPLREAPWLDAHGCSAVTRAATLHAVDGLTTSTALTVDTWRRGPEHLQRHYLLQHAPVVVTTIQQTPVASCALSAGFCVSESLGRCNERSELGKGRPGTLSAFFHLPAPAHASMRWRSVQATTPSFHFTSPTP